MRIANNSFIGSQGLAGFFNSPLSNQDNLISRVSRSVDIIPGRDGNQYLPPEERYRGSLASIPRVVEKALKEIIIGYNEKDPKKVTIAYLADGPYGVLKY